MEPIVFIDDFLNRGIHQALEPKPRNILFATYNHVRGVNAGAQTYKEGNLIIEVQNGYFDPPSLLQVMSSPISVEEQGVAARIMETIAENVDQQALDLAFVYAGVSSFKVPVEFAERIGARVPTYIISCDCNLIGSHRRRLEMAVKPEGVRRVIMTRFCGGETAMRQVYDRIIELS